MPNERSQGAGWKSRLARAIGLSGTSSLWLAAAAAGICLVVSLNDAGWAAYVVLLAVSACGILLARFESRGDRQLPAKLGLVANGVLSAGLLGFLALAAIQELRHPGSVPLHDRRVSRQWREDDARQQFDEALRVGNVAAARKIADRSPVVLVDRQKIFDRLLLKAVVERRRELAVFLVEQCRADVNRMTDWRYEGRWHSQATPLFLAAQQGDLEFVRLLIQWGADPNHAWQPEQLPLAAAARNGDVALTAYLLRETEAEIDPEGTPPLFYAARAGHPMVVDLLLHGGANPNAVCVQGSSLTAAIDSSSYEVTALLLIRGANPNRCSRSDGGVPEFESALHRSVAASRHDLAELLLRHEANVNISCRCATESTPRWKTPLDLAFENADQPMIDLLLGYGGQRQSELDAQQRAAVTARAGEKIL
jgi:hypothetical protein